MPLGKAGFYFVPSDVLIRKFLRNYIHLTKFFSVRRSRVILLKPTALHWIYSGSQAPGKPLQGPGLHPNSTTPEEILAVCPADTGMGSARWFSMAWTFAEMQGTDSRRRGGRRHFIKMFFPLQEQQKGQNVTDSHRPQMSWEQYRDEGLESQRDFVLALLSQALNTEEQTISSKKTAILLIMLRTDEYSSLGRSCALTGVYLSALNN